MSTFNDSGSWRFCVPFPFEVRGELFHCQNFQVMGELFYYQEIHNKIIEAINAATMMTAHPILFNKNI